MAISAIGKMRGTPEESLFKRYQTRLRLNLEIKEIHVGGTSSAEQKHRENVALLDTCKEDEFVIALDLAGKNLDSLALADKMREWQETGKNLRFVIGGAQGLDRALLERANFTISLGKMTWPHMLVRVMLMEQLFRSQSILEGHPYHRDDRPT
ncbi:23S rRNA (pseudouridine(1915)-N(3))-methyltransferase RlmH [Acetobacteraceae bacterium]|nr:23S rRNA (pseudouridine(1915)-N(3))-methyltransferase RlmH [Acetobacteraceae bacterium]QCE34993.1 23S rRNA (pseudouridine(1915)-N(3))-methyltransferase RlmH [Acetobacteraceae bacterium]